MGRPPAKVPADLQAKLKTSRSWSPKVLHEDLLPAYSQPYAGYVKVILDKTHPPDEKVSGGERDLPAAQHRADAKALGPP